MNSEAKIMPESISRWPKWLASVCLAASLAALLFSLFLLISILNWQSQSATRVQLSGDYSETLTNLERLLQANASSDQLAKVVALGDVQTSKLHGSGLSWFKSSAMQKATKELDIDWLTLRTELLKLNASVASVPVAKVETVTRELPENAQSVSTDLVQQLASDYDTLFLRLFEGTQSSSVRQLATDISAMWSRAAAQSYKTVDQAELQLHTQRAQELIDITRVNTDQSLFGYQISNQINAYANRLGTAMLDTPVPIPPPTPTVIQNTPVRTTDNTVALYAFDQANQSLQVYRNELSLAPQRMKRALLLTTLLFVGALGVLAMAGWNLLRRSETHSSKSMQDEQENAREYRVTPHFSDPVSEPVADMPERRRDVQKESSIDSNPESSLDSNFESNRGSQQQTRVAEEAKRVIKNIEAVAAGDLRQPISIPQDKNNAAIVNAVNQTSSVMQNLVRMTRGVADRITGLVRHNEILSQKLAQSDVERQRNAAEVSEHVGVSSQALNDQTAALSEIQTLATRIANSSAAPVNDLNAAEETLATLGAQVDVSIERIQRLQRTTNQVNELTVGLKSAAENTRLQALNLSLQTSEVSFDSAEDAAAHESSDAIDEMHMLTGQLVQRATEASKLLSHLSNDLVATSESFKLSRQDISNTAERSRQSSKGDRDLSGDAETLSQTIESLRASVQTQKDNLAATATLLVALDKTSNQRSDSIELLTQEVGDLQDMAAKLRQSVADFKLQGEQ